MPRGQPRLIDFTISNLPPAKIPPSASRALLPESVKVRRDMLSRAPVTQISPRNALPQRTAAPCCSLAIPVVLSELGWMAMSIVDTIMVGRLSPAAIGAVGISSAIFYTPALFGIGLLLGLDTLVAQAFGRGDFDDCHRALAQGVYLAIGYTPIAMLLVGFAPHLFPSWESQRRCAVRPRQYIASLTGARCRC